jgi:hypothetical protein
VFLNAGQVRYTQDTFSLPARIIADGCHSLRATIAPAVSGSCLRSIPGRRNWLSSRFGRQLTSWMGERDSMRNHGAFFGSHFAHSGSGVEPRGFPSRRTSFPNRVIGSAAAQGVQRAC